MSGTMAKTRRKSRAVCRLTEDQRQVRRLDYYAKLRHWLELPWDTDHPEIPKGLI
ncbi:hypothetical protein [Mycolicibacterium sarraceniae]|uniref:Uncharacterized protein n=1 Tax=Mycolicibacterium sarraceniae TaxID=1534348 RepID=A0A7I7STK4_9MYCO|nr:hypothetical protein [Mycolicibacterium sarraceniae]BBY60327.1 hypothetical protein MSAR_34630 [Mycolicibacterium sarraceniae]